MSVARPMGIETEYGILQPGNVYANAVAMSHTLVTAYVTEGRAAGEGRVVRWDYGGEDPLNDARGHRLERWQADPSQLTDDPDRPAPAGPDARDGGSVDGSVDGRVDAAGDGTVDCKVDSTGGTRGPRRDAERLTGGRPGSVRRPSSAEENRPQAASVVLTNGARLYVDHAHPEYSGPECLTPREAVRWDRAGDQVMADAMELVRRTPGAAELAVFKNNVDGKGASYGCHENYLVSRAVPFAEIVTALTPFFVTRPVYCGAGRVGLGQRSERPGFQISQRADYVENEVGLETTFNRPIINTRDEPHADAEKYRRLHVIGGDANSFDVSTYLKLGTTSLVLWVLEQRDLPQARAAHEAFAALAMDDPVLEARRVSHDPTLQHRLGLLTGAQVTALEVQHIYLDAVRACLAAHAEATGTATDAQTTEVVERWARVLDLLGTDPTAAAREVEWVAKYQLLDRLRRREGGSWSAPRVLATDVQWHDLRPERSVLARLDAAGRIERLVTPEEVAAAEVSPPTSTRAYLRGEVVRRYPGQVPAASWSSVVLDVPGRADLVRLPLKEPTRATAAHVRDVLDASPTTAELLAALTGG